MKSVLPPLHPLIGSENSLHCIFDDKEELILEEKYWSKCAKMVEIGTKMERPAEYSDDNFITLPFSSKAMKTLVYFMDNGNLRGQNDIVEMIELVIFLEFKSEGIFDAFFEMINATTMDIKLESDLGDYLNINGIREEIVPYLVEKYYDILFDVVTFYCYPANKFDYHMKPNVIRSIIRDMIRGIPEGIGDKIIEEIVKKLEDQVLILPSENEEEAENDKDKVSICE